jgi:hypothetical protein
MSHRRLGTTGGRPGPWIILAPARPVAKVVDCLDKFVGNIPAFPGDCLALAASCAAREARARDPRSTGATGVPRSDRHGLPIARQIVEAHGGTITVEPVASGGTRFLVTLPLPDGRA